MLFLGKEFLPPPGISPEGGGTCLLLGHWASCLSLGVQGEGEPRADGQGEVEGLALLCQCQEEIVRIRIVKEEASLQEFSAGTFGSIALAADFSLGNILNQHHRRAGHHHKQL